MLMFSCGSYMIGSMLLIAREVLWYRGTSGNVLVLREEVGTVFTVMGELLSLLGGGSDMVGRKYR